MLNRIKQFLDTRPDPIGGTSSTSPYRFWQDTGIGRDTAYRMYNDPTYIPTSKALNKICGAYRIQPGSFLSWEPDNSPLELTSDIEISEVTNSQSKKPVNSGNSKKRGRTRSQLSLVPDVLESA
jgi:DNA-binding Xre family transcriptional regulator